MDENDVILREVDLRKLVKRLDILDENVIRHAEEQPHLYLRAARFRARKQHELIEADRKLDLAKAEASLKLRKADRDGKPRTEAYYKELVLQDSRVRKYQKRYNAAVVADEFAKQLLEAYRQRAQSIRIIGSVMGAEALSEIRFGESDKARKMKEKIKAHYRDFED